MPSVYRPRSEQGYNAGMGRFFQFRLRTLFVVVALAALLAWQLPPAVERYRREQWVLNRVKSYEAHLRRTLDAETAREKAEKYEKQIRVAEFVEEYEKKQRAIPDRP
jgi:hypothetical protein